MNHVCNINTCFARVLRELRSQAGISQEKLALEADLDRTFISLLERGLRQPSLKSLFAIASVLQVQPHEIVQAVENEMSSSSKAQ